MLQAMTAKEITDYVRDGNDILDTYIASRTPSYKARLVPALQSSAEMWGFGIQRTGRIRQSNGIRGRQ